MIVNASGEAKITCSGSGVPVPRIYWNQTGLKSNFTVTSRMDGLVQDLVFHNASAYDNGWIACVAESVAKRTVLTFRFEVRGNKKETEAHHYTPQNECFRGGGGYTGINLSVRPCVRLCTKNNFCQSSTVVIKKSHSVTALVFKSNNAE